MHCITQKEQEIQKLTTELGSTKAEVSSLQERLEKSNQENEALYQAKYDFTQKELEVKKLAAELRSTKAEALRLQNGLEKRNRRYEALYQTMEVPGISNDDVSIEAESASASD